MEHSVRVALIGFGGMGQTYARMIFGGMVKGMTLTGVCCRNEAGQALLKAEFPGVRRFTLTRTQWLPVGQTMTR